MSAMFLDIALLLLLPSPLLLLLVVQVGAIKDLCDLVFNPPDGEACHCGHWSGLDVGRRQPYRLASCACAMHMKLFFCVSSMLCPCVWLRTFYSCLPCASRRFSAAAAAAASGAGVGVTLEQVEQALALFNEYLVHVSRLLGSALLGLLP
jgi:hypothetical protein